MDTIIKDGLVIDGTGAPGRHADVGIANGRIAVIGDLDGNGARVIDADGLVVAPGFVDVHTHIDAQAFWDAALSGRLYAGATGIHDVLVAGQQIAVDGEYTGRGIGAACARAG